MSWNDVALLVGWVQVFFSEKGWVILTPRLQFTPLLSGSELCAIP